MEFRIDKTGALVVRFSIDKYIQVLPVTKYQFERFVWESAPSLDYETMLTGRASPEEVTRENLPSAFMTNINFEEAQKSAQWFGARLPTVKEWEEAYDTAFRDENLFEEALEYMVRLKTTHRIERRILKLLEGLCKLGIKRSELECGELVSEFSQEPYGRIYLKYSNNQQALVTGNPGRKTRDTNFGFCWVVNDNPGNDCKKS